jgi:hypothetical protein
MPNTSDRPKEPAARLNLTGYIFKKSFHKVWWLMPVIPATQIQGLGGSHFRDNPGKKLAIFYPNKKTWHCVTHLSSQPHGRHK